MSMALKALPQPTRFLVLVIAAICAPTVHAQRNAPLEVPTDPEKEKATFQVDPAFEVNLFAGDPMLAKPIQMAWDSKGRLWVACSETYPQIKPGDKANDKILILEDTDGDGKADKTTVFAEGLLIPTGVEPDLNGVYVADSTELVYLQDTNGDGKADKRTVVLSGFGTEDTHHLLHTIRFGPDARLYFNQSIYIHSHLETPHGPKRLGGGGTWAMRTKSLELDIIMRGLVNPWGLSWDRNGQVFETDGAGGEGINLIIPGGWYFTAVGARRIFPGLNPGSPKDCGLEMISGLHLPAGWDGNLITNDFRGHRVCRYQLSDDGAGFQAREMPELIRSNHPAFRPIDVRQGPDGAIYIADWFNPIIQHGEVDFRDPRRDKTHGRIWRLTPKGKAAPPRPKLVEASDADLVQALKSDLGWTRHHARLVMRERRPEAMEPLLQTLCDNASDALLMEILWSKLAIERPDFALIARLAKSENPSVRAGALRALSWSKADASQRAALVERTKNDAHPRVRLEVIRLLGIDSTIENLRQALSYLSKPLDRFEEYALWLTVNDLRSLWGEVIRTNTLDQFSGQALVYAVRATDDLALGNALRDLVKQVKDPSSAPLMEALIDMGDKESLQLVWSKLPIFASDYAAANRLFSGIEKAAAKLEGKAPPLDPATLKPFLAQPATLASAARVAGALHLQALAPTLDSLLDDERRALPERAAALQGLSLMGGAQIEKTLDKLAEKSLDPLAADALLAAARLNPSRVAARVVNALNGPKGADLAPRIAREFAAMAKGPAILAQALAQASLPKDTARILVRELSNLPKTDVLRDAVKKAGKLDTATRTGSSAEVANLVALAREKGDPSRGQDVFRRKNLQCFKCHSIGSAGGLVGPELASIGGSAQPDYILESLLLPNKAIKENYHTTVATTKNAKVYSGIKVKLDDRELILRNAENELVTVPRSQIDELAQGQSLMPAGLIDELTDGELADLVRFLSDLGKVPAVSLPREPWARNFVGLVNNSLSWEMQSHGGPGAFTAKPNEPGLIWETLIPRLNGELPVGEMVPFKRDLKVLRADFEVSVAGRFRLTLDDWTGVRAFVGPVSIDPATPEFDLAKGTHSLILGVNPEVRKKGLRMMVAESPGTAGRIRPLAP